MYFKKNRADDKYSLFRQDFFCNKYSNVHINNFLYNSKQYFRTEYINIEL